MAYSTISKSGLHFNTVTYVGNGSTNAITGVGFQPDIVWTKNRSATQNHLFYDAVRGAGYYLYPNLTNGQGGDGTSALDSFDSDGFTLDGGDDSNVNGQNGVAWSWKAGNSSGSANSDGDISSTVSVNTTAGISIVKYTGNGSAQTVGHGLNAVPKWILLKRIPDNGYDWIVYHVEDSAGLYLNSIGYNNDSSSNNIWFNGAAPTSSVFTTGTDGRIGGNGVNYMAYCFAEKQGFSKFGSF